MEEGDDKGRTTKVGSKGGEGAIAAWGVARCCR